MKEYPDTFFNVTTKYITQTQVESLFSDGILKPEPNVRELKRLWCEASGGYPVPSFNNWFNDSKILQFHDDDCGFCGDVYQLLKEYHRLKGISTNWLETEYKGRIYYGSLYPYACSTGRCAPKPSYGFIPGMGHEIADYLIHPQEGRKIAVLDFKSQGLCLLAALSGDPVMTKAAVYGDAYTYLAKILGVIPPDIWYRYSYQDCIRLERYRWIVKRIMIPYMYGAGDERLNKILPVQNDEMTIKQKLDSLFYFYCKWKTLLKSEVKMPDGFLATGRSSSVVMVQAYDSYILREICLRMESLFKEAEVIATNHDSIYVECETEFDVNPIADMMIQVADEVTHTKGLFNVRVNEIHRNDE